MERKLKIAQLVPPWIPVPPKAYGGIERVVYYLTEGLTSRGHEVTLFASGDSQTSARLISPFLEALGNIGELKNNPTLQLLQVSPCFEMAGEFDIIHSHMVYQAAFFANLVKTPVVHTLHGSFIKGEVPEERRRLLEKYKNQNFVSISFAQREGLPDLNFVANIYNGVNIDEFEYGEGGGYLSWLGRITPKKGVVEAIEVARILGKKLKIAAFIDPIDQPFFEMRVKPLIDGQQIELVGELKGTAKSDFLKASLALLFPIDWHEPFGIVMIEAMACGTPVVAFDRGSVSEVVVSGKTGFVVDPNLGVDGLVEAVKKIDQIDRLACRRHVEENFSVKKMIDRYEEAYKKILAKQ